MNYIIRFTLVFLMALCLTGFTAHMSNQEKEQSDKPKVAILGTFHFAGSSSDMADIKMADPLGKRRQKEIMELVKVLKKYKPTKVMVEYPASKADALNDRFNQYLNSNYELGTSETYQVGFRLAKELNHKRIFAIDKKLNLPMNKVVEYCQRTNKMGEFNTFVGGIQSLMGEETKKLEELTIREYLATMNTDGVDKLANEVYLKDLLVFGDTVYQAGVEVAAEWWKRNIMIYKNISEAVDSEEDRVLVIIGSSHRAIIKDFVQDRSDLEYVEIGAFLGK